MNKNSNVNINMLIFYIFGKVRVDGLGYEHK